jgi:hypothetical protein
MHLVNWNVFKEPKTHGGLRILDPSLFNMVLGEKILWRLVSGNWEWWKKVIIHKYMVRDRLRFLDSPPARTNGSPIWKLLKYSMPLFQIKSTWIPGNGCKISIWEDNIMGNFPLQQKSIFYLDGLV